jgi:hypothetical protein
VPNLKWSPTASTRIGELAGHIDEMVHGDVAMKGGSLPGAHRPACNNQYAGKLGWAFEHTNEPINCLKCIAMGL